MSYDNPMTIPYQWAAHDFGAGGATLEIRGPAGKRGILKDIILFDITETFTNVTTSGYVRVGDGSDADIYGELDCLAYSAGSTASAKAATETATNAINGDQTIPADSTVTIMFGAPTGGTPAGIASVQVVIDWF